MEGYEGQADGCDCSLFLPSKAVPQVNANANANASSDLPAFWVSPAYDAFNKYEWNDRVDTVVAMIWIDSLLLIMQMKHLPREAILASHEWVKPDITLDLFDKCIDEMLTQGQLKRTWSLDECYGSNLEEDSE